MHERRILFGNVAHASDSDNTEKHQFACKLGPSPVVSSTAGGIVSRGGAMASPDQLVRLRALPPTPFYRAKGVALAAVQTVADFRRLPFTTKAELVADQAADPPYGTNHAGPLTDYGRVHQTSGTSTGRPLKWLDTPASWDWLLDCWADGFVTDIVLSAADRVFFPFSFGPFLGFWAGFEALARRGTWVIPGGGMPTAARLRYLIENAATMVCCTPTYALHMAEVAVAEGLDLSGSPVRAVVVAGEPGGSIPATRSLIETAWGARVFDHYGLTEVGPVAFESRDTPGRLRVLTDQFIVECLKPDTDRDVPPGEVGELVVTNLGRLGSPLIRYRTGDLVKLTETAAGTYLDGGVLGRADDMIHVRGNNLYPTAVEAILRRFPDVAEFRIVIDTTRPLADLRLDVEPTPTADPARLCQQVADAIQNDLLFRAAVTAVPPGTLPRFEMKAKRVVKIK